MIHRARVALTQVLVALHQLELADAMSREILAYARASADRRSEHFGWHYLADCALIAGRCDESLSLYGQSLNLAEAIGDRLETGFEIQGIAMSMAGLGEPALGIRLDSAVRAENARLGVDPHMRFWDELLERYLGAARTALGPIRATHAEEDGRAMSFERAIATAREASRSSDLSATTVMDPARGEGAS
jgi:tetratricopeptide (TPR) repeat protein